MTHFPFRTILACAVANALAAVPARAADYATTFDQLWAEMDRHYSHF